MRGLLGSRGHKGRKGHGEEHDYGVGVICIIVDMGLDSIHMPSRCTMLLFQASYLWPGLPSGFYLTERVHGVMTCWS